MRHRTWVGGRRTRPFRRLHPALSGGSPEIAGGSTDDRSGRTRHHRCTTSIRTATIATRALAASAAILLTLALVLHARSGGYGNLRWAFEAVYAAAFVALGLLVARHRSGNAFGPLFALLAVGTAFTTFGNEYAYLALTDDRSLPAAEWVEWGASWSWALLFPVLACVYYFVPTMHLASRRWRPAFWFSLLVTSTLSLAIALQPGSLAGDERGDVLARLTNPLTGADEGGPLDTWFAAAYPLMAIGMALAGAATISRYRASEGGEREQLRFLVYGVAPFPVIMIFGLAVPAPAGPMIAYALSTVDLLVIAEAVLRGRWFGIRVVVNRSLVYGALTLGGLALYALVVFVADAVLPEGASLAGAAAVAIAFAPLHTALQRAVDRLMYGDRQDPYRAVTRLGERLGASLSPDDVLPAIVATIAETMRLPYTAIDTATPEGRPLTAAWGARTDADLELVDLPFGGEVVGTLAVEARAGESALGEDDRRLLTDLARQAGAAVHAVVVGVELQRSREQIVRVLEDERRRIRRDLHDGLGPALTAVTLHLDLLAKVVGDDPAKAQAMAIDLRGEVKDAIGEIRRLVNELRPPALDELGLLGALREHARRLGRDVAMTIDAGELPALPAAVEVAAYRIATEAMTNVARHSQARTCTIRVAYDGALDVCVEDDGIGAIETWRPGVGLRSMHARAAELGGTCSVEVGAFGGGTVHATIPVAGS